MDFEFLGFAPVLAITVLCFLGGFAWKLSPLPDRWIPVVCGLVGLVLGVVGRTVIDGFPAADPITAAAIGVVSGLAATGAHQVYKQLVEDPVREINNLAK